jgi:hypothetical protein
MALRLFALPQNALLSVKKSERGLLSAKQHGFLTRPSRARKKGALSAPVVRAFH